MRFFLLSVALLICFFSVSAFPLKLRINNETGIYKRGEIVSVSCSCYESLKDSILVSVYVNNNVTEKYKFWTEKTDFTLFSKSYDETVAVMVELSVQGDSEKIGFVVAPENFRPGYEEPDDFMSFWDNQKQLLKSLPLQVKTSVLQVPEKFAGKYECRDVEINCLGPAPVRAYMAKPVGARKKTLPIIVFCHSAGVSGSWCLCNIDACVGNAAIGNGALSLDINAHGMLNGQSQQFYKMLENGPLRAYRDDNPADCETYYFKGMYLRLLRAIDYMTKQPEWDGKRILVVGESQGGGQAAAIAGLDKRVSAVVMIVPALQDLGGMRVGRRSGWPQPIEKHQYIDKEMIDNVLPYFDGSLLLSHSSAEVFCEVGLIDTICPPSSVWSSFNLAKGNKKLYCFPYRPHSVPSGEMYQLWKEKILKPRLEFINKYLSTH